MLLFTLLKSFFLYILLFSFFLNSIVFHNLEEHQQILDLAKEFPSVGFLNLQFRNKNNTKVITTHCSGVLIDPLTVITLAECLEPLADDNFTFDKDTNYFAANTFKLGNDVFNNPFITSKIKNAVFYTGYQKNNPLSKAQNLALIFLEKPIYNIKPAKLYNKSQNLLNKKVVLVGFGLYGLPVNNYTQKNHEYLASNHDFDFHKRACWQKITNSNRSFLETSFSMDNQELFGMFTHGDQGGAMFIKENEQWYLLGINSHRLVPKYDNQDTRDIAYNTIGFSLAIPSYLGWIRNNQALQKAISGNTISNAEWSFNPYWKKGIFPHNNLEHNHIFHAIIKSESNIMFDNFINLNKLSIDHENANVYIPFKLPVTLTTNEIENHITDLFKNDKKFEAIEYQRSLITDKDNNISRILKIQTNDIKVKNGTLHVAGEIWFTNCLIKEGRIMGNGVLIHDTNPVINESGEVMPGDLNNVGTLSIIGDYKQINGHLIIKTKKSKNKLQNSVLNIKGEAFLDGVLFIKDDENNLAHNDKIKFLYGKNQGKFANIKLPTDLSYKISYNSDNIVLVIKDKHYAKNLEITDLEKITFQRVKKLSSILINNGTLVASKKINLDSEIFLKSGLIKMPKSELGKKLYINGNYRQTSGKLKLRIYKSLIEVTDEKDFIIENGNLVPAQNLSNKQTHKIGHPQFKFSNDNLYISGAAYLGGHLELKFADEVLIKENTKLILIKAQKIQGKFASVSKLKGNIQPELIYEDDQVSVIFKNTHKLSDLDFTSPQALLLATVLEKEREINPNAFATLFLVLNGLSAKEVENYLLKNVLNTPAAKRLIKKFN